MGFYDYSAKKINGQEVKMDAYAGKVVIVVNTASKCGLTPQFEGLEALYREYKDRGLEILGFPCNQFASQEPGDSHAIEEFCTRNYGVSFTMFEKIDVNGEHTHPLYQYLKKEKKTIVGADIAWNFAKFLIDSEGKVVKRYLPTTAPQDMRKDIEKLLVAAGR